MARPREFDIDDAVKKAMTVFWKQGYAGASLPDLLEGMGIARGSFYKAFGSKKAVFLKALDQYDAENVKPGIAVLAGGGGDGLDRIDTAFNNNVIRTLEGDRTGCLLCNSAAENGDEDPEIACKVEDQLSRLTDGFATALRGSAIWSSATDDARMAQAHSLTMSYVGLRILSKSGGAEALKQSVERTLSMLRRGP